VLLQAVDKLVENILHVVHVHIQVLLHFPQLAIQGIQSSFFEVLRLQYVLVPDVKSILHCGEFAPQPLDSFILALEEARTYFLYLLYFAPVVVSDLFDFISHLAFAHLDPIVVFGNLFLNVLELTLRQLLNLGYQ